MFARSDRGSPLPPCEAHIARGHLLSPPHAGNRTAFRLLLHPRSFNSMSSGDPCCDRIRRQTEKASRDCRSIDEGSGQPPRQASNNRKQCHVPASQVARLEDAHPRNASRVRRHRWAWPLIHLKEMRHHELFKRIHIFRPLFADAPKTSSSLVILVRFDRPTAQPTPPHDDRHCAGKQLVIRVRVRSDLPLAATHSKQRARRAASGRVNMNGRHTPENGRREKQRAEDECISNKPQ